jgi:hypothetical protein
MIFPDVALIDIDGVLAGKNYATLLELCNEFLHLGILPTTLACVPSMEGFHCLPEVQTYCAREGYETFISRVKWLGFHPRHIRACAIEPGAVEGVQQLSLCVRDLGYCTARKIISDERWDQGLSQATHHWLHTSGFPNDDQVLFCQQPVGKLKAIAAVLEAEPAQILLIDDSVGKLLAAYAELLPHEQLLLARYLTIGGFGATEHVQQPIRMIPLCSWEQADIDTFLTCIRKEQKDAALEEKYEYGWRR